MPLRAPLRAPSTLAAAALAAVLAAPSLAAAQARPAAPASSDEYVQSVAANILAFPFGLFSAEYEHALVWPGFSFGVGGSILAEGDTRDRWVSAKLLYYPEERAFRGFSVGVTAGVHSARPGEDCDFFTDSCTVEPGDRQTAPTLGVLVNYDWLLGRTRRFRIGTGIGAKRVLKDVDSRDPLEQVYPDGRFVVGIAF